MVYVQTSRHWKQKSLQSDSEREVQRIGLGFVTDKKRQDLKNNGLKNIDAEDKLAKEKYSEKEAKRPLFGFWLGQHLERIGRKLQQGSDSNE